MNTKASLPAGLLAALLAGCSGGSDEWTEKRPAVVPAEGVVTVDGKPVEGAAVVLAPSGGGGNSASAVSGEDGRFALQAFPPNDGAVPGSYMVMISKTVEIKGGAAGGGTDAGHAAGSDVVGWKNDLPAAYADPKKSKLTVEIPQEGTTDLKFDLKSSGP